MKNIQTHGDWIAITQWMGQEGDQGTNQKVSGNKWNQTHNGPKLMGHSEGSPKREVHRDTSIPKKGRDISNKQPNPTSTRTGGTTGNKGQSK